MTESLFEVIKELAASTPDIIFIEFTDELEHYLGVHTLADKARREFLAIK
jgi:hypothetical protein